MVFTWTEIFGNVDVSQQCRPLLFLTCVAIAPCFQCCCLVLFIVLTDCAWFLTLVQRPDARIEQHGQCNQTVARNESALAPNERPSLCFHPAPYPDSVTVYPKSCDIVSSQPKYFILVCVILAHSRVAVRGRAVHSELPHWDWGQRDQLWPQRTSSTAKSHVFFGCH